MNLCSFSSHFWKVCTLIQSSLGLRIKSLVTNSLDCRPPPHQDSSASRLFISNPNTLIPADYRSLTNLHIPWGVREREKERNMRDRKRDGRQADHAQQLSSIFTSSNPAKREGEKDGSHFCWPPCSCCFNMPRRPQPVTLCRTAINLCSFTNLSSIRLLFCLKKTSACPVVWSTLFPKLQGYNGNVVLYWLIVCLDFKICFKNPSVWSSTMWTRHNILID